jgi:hypothetical protein
LGGMFHSEGITLLPDHPSFTCARAASVWGSQNVMSIDWYMAQ